MDGINTLNDLMFAMARALEERNVERLEELQAYSEGWLQDPSNARAQAALFDAMTEAAELLLDNEDNDNLTHNEED